MTLPRPSAASAPYFAFEAEVRAVPSSPTHCVGCGAALEPLRRYAGLCRQCVVAREPSWRARPEPSRFELLGEFLRGTRAGRQERWAEVRCSCGRKRWLKWATWEHHRPACCNKCRLRGVEQNGFEAEYAR